MKHAIQKAFAFEKMTVRAEPCEKDEQPKGDDSVPMSHRLKSGYYRNRAAFSPRGSVALCRVV
jgi:hypothetical protein